MPEYVFRYSYKVWETRRFTARAANLDEARAKFDQLLAQIEEDAAEIDIETDSSPADADREFVISHPRTDRVLCQWQEPATEETHADP